MDINMANTIPDQNNTQVLQAIGMPFNMRD